MLAKIGTESKDWKHGQKQELNRKTGTHGQILKLKKKTYTYS